MNLQEASGAAVAFVLFVIILGIGASILSGIQGSQFTTAIDAGCTLAKAQAGQINCTTAAFNTTGFGLTGITNISQQSGTIGIVLAAAILIGIVVGAFYMGGRKEGSAVA